MPTLLEYLYEYLLEFPCIISITNYHQYHAITII